MRNNAHRIWIFATDWAAIFISAFQLLHYIIPFYTSLTRIIIGIGSDWDLKSYLRKNNGTVITAFNDGYTPIIKNVERILIVQ